MALLLDLCDGPTAMLTLDDDCVSVVFPPSAADSPEITRPLEKLRFPKRRLSVDEDEDTCADAGRRRREARLRAVFGGGGSVAVVTWLERCWCCAVWSCELIPLAPDSRGTWEKMEAMEVLKDSWLLDRRWTRPWDAAESRMGPDWLLTGGRWLWGWTERLRYSLLAAGDSRGSGFGGVGWSR